MNSPSSERSSPANPDSEATDARNFSDVGLSKMLDGEGAKEVTGRKEIERTHGDAVGSTLVCS